MNKVLITGSQGQLGTELIRTAPPSVQLHAVSRTELDITNEDMVRAYLDEHQPDAIVNAAAYTAVDKAEQDELAARAINYNGVINLAKFAAPETYLLHISTDFVFDGTKNTPYTVNDETRPKSVYGRTKLDGELALAELKADKSAVIRTSWVYSTAGANFVKSMLRFMQERDELNIVVDQVGTPTWAKGLAEACWSCLDKRNVGTFHWSDAGVASWYDFAVHIQTLGLEFGFLKKEIPLNPIPSSSYPTPAERPSYSVLDKSALLNVCSDLKNVHWMKQLRSMFEELKLNS